jgi:hypothetical protein
VRLIIVTFERKRKLRLEVWREKEIYHLILSTMEQRTHFQPNLYAHAAHTGELLNRVPIGVPPFSSTSEGLMSMLKGPSISVPAPASLHQ